MQAAREHRTRPTVSGMTSASIDEEGDAAEARSRTQSPTLTHLASATG